MSDEILWINHAGYELRADGVRIVHDPWLDGLAFDNGWALVSESRYRYDDFTGVDYIWLSHEHPDHFAPHVLRNIPAAVRATITVLFQRRRDRRVVDFCRQLGFVTQELDDGRRVVLKNGVAVTCGVVDDDSWLFVETSQRTYFNANDCIAPNWAAIARRLARPVDVLLTQFSYANWAGNPGDRARMAAFANAKLLEMEQQIAALRPTLLIPFASFVWFCREENFHLNEGVNRIDRVYERFRSTIATAVLYPGDTFRLGEPGDAESAVERYLRDWNAHQEPLTIQESAVTIDELKVLSQRHQDELRGRNALWLLRPLAWIGYLQPVAVYLSDLGVGLRYGMFGGILDDRVARSDCEVEFRSTSFANMLRNGYGYGTLNVNGRFRELKPGGYGRLSPHFAVARQNEQGFNFPGMLLRNDYVVAHLRRVVRYLAGR
jgi:L-ascorbate metabolism protein UlaG (beta-lactamase superfamily)